MTATDQIRERLREHRGASPLCVEGGSVSCEVCRGLERDLARALEEEKRQADLFRGELSP